MCLQAQSSFSLTITWTPTEEGGIRELIVFNANGVLKHQAVLLGRAEAPKKKKVKYLHSVAALEEISCYRCIIIECQMLIYIFLLFQKSLWDTIKNKRGDEKVAVPRGKKTEPSLKIASNKTLQGSRKPQYKRDKPRSPLASINEGKAVRERNTIPYSPIEDHHQKSEVQKALKTVHKQRSLALTDQKNFLHVPATQGTGVLVSPDTLAVQAENKMLNRTLSPIGTPEMFKKLMPRIPSVESPASMKSVSDADSVLPRRPGLSLKEALALIDSDLINTPREAGSSSGFSDSLESSGHDNEPRLTFFVSKKGPEALQKASFNSATVIKGKAPVMEACLSGRKIKRSRRRLLENTLELSDSGNQSESGPGTPRLPVIDLDTRSQGAQNSGETISFSFDTQVQELPSASLTPRADGSPTPITFPVTSPPLHSPFSFSVTSPPPAVPTLFSFTSPPPLSQSSPLHSSLSSNHNESSPTAFLPRVSAEGTFSVHRVMKSKKRKSEEYLKSGWKVEDAGRTERVKRTRVAAGKTEPIRSKPERRSATQRQQPKAAGGFSENGALTRDLQSKDGWKCSELSVNADFLFQARCAQRVHL